MFFFVARSLATSKWVTASQLSQPNLPHPLTAALARRGEVEESRCLQPKRAKTEETTTRSAARGRPQLPHLSCPGWRAPAASTCLLCPFPPRHLPAHDLSLRCNRASARMRTALKMEIPATMIRTTPSRVLETITTTTTAMIKLATNCHFLILTRPAASRQQRFQSRLRRSAVSAIVTAPRTWRWSRRRRPRSPRPPGRI